LQKLEKDKQKLSELLTTKNIPKPTHAEAPKIKEESLPNLNKKTSTDVPIDNEKDAFLFKKTVTTTEEKKEKKEEKETDQSKAQTPVTKKIIPITDLVHNVKTKKHRGINTIDELEKKTGGSPKVPNKEDEQKKKQDYKPNQEKDTNQSNENKQQGNTQDTNQSNENKQQQRPRNDNYRGNNRDDNRGQRNRPRKGVQLGRGEFDIGSTDDFPSLSDNIEVPSKPFWLPNQSQQQ